MHVRFSCTFYAIKIDMTSLPKR